MDRIRKLFRKSRRGSEYRRGNDPLSTGATLPPGKKLYEVLDSQRIRESGERRQSSRVLSVVRILWRWFLASTVLTGLLILIGGEQLRKEGLTQSVLPIATFAGGLCYAVIRSGVGRLHAGGAVLAGLLGFVIALEGSHYEQKILSVGAGIATGGVVFAGWFLIRKWFIRAIDKIIR